MNWYIFIAGLLAGFTTFGHFTMGSKSYLKPMLKADLDIISKKVMHCVFHYVSVYLILSCFVLLGAGIGLKNIDFPTVLLHFIAIHYTAFALVQIVIALTSKIQKSLFKMFQWTFFILIASLTWLGIFI